MNRSRTRSNAHVRRDVTREHVQRMGDEAQPRRVSSTISTYVQLEGTSLNSASSALSMAFSPNGGYLASSDAAKKLIVRDVESGEQKHSFTHDGRGHHGIALWPSTGKGFCGAESGASTYR